MSTGSTSDFTLTRDELIELGYKLIGVLQPIDPNDDKEPIPF